MDVLRRGQGITAADGNGVVPAAQTVIIVQVFFDAGEQFIRIIFIGITAKQIKFISAEPCTDILRGKNADKGLSDDLDGKISFAVSVGVINVLKTVEVK